MCGSPLEMREHIFFECPLWIRRHTWSAHLQHLQELDPFKEIVPFLEDNLLAATFEF